ncbi:MAG: leucine--tRNA ligase [Cryomorphaceae bacterium BACL21 MAG-121220-bin10]|jgi:leucyl-tRNA synthetase|nr:MAG: leucine--tRNA ligase [Cryomorphaceae bacterium BACL21 MAG-121220-bin10]
MSNYPFRTLEEKWQNYWAKHQTFKAEQQADLPKFYVLDMFPYPSGAGLHVGHPLGYIASDIYARYMRHKGFNVLHPQGYDSFGLPAEQYAIQTGQHPKKTTQENIARYREQLDKMGFSFDWSREVRTSNADYYRWTQWIFMQLFDSWYDLEHQKARPIDTLVAHFEANGTHGICAVCDDNALSFAADQWKAMSWEQQQKHLLHYRMTYLAESEVNWCPNLGTVLANDEIINGVSERGGHPVVRKKMKQWSMRISAYAQRLIDGLEAIDWPQPLKEAQRNWIGRSQGASVVFSVQGHDQEIDVFTTRPDTIFGVSFLTLAPEHELVDKIVTPDQKEAVAQYILATAQRSERERMADVKTISGVFTGAYAAHPLTNEPIPIWIGDYVLAGYGTGAVMAVPCGDQRDYDFAKHFDLPIPNIFADVDLSEQAYTLKDPCIIAASDFLNGLTYQKASQKAIEALEQNGRGSGKINYRLRDAVFSRQRYWGEPFPVYYKQGLPQMIPVEALPLKLPEVDAYLPTQGGDPPLGRASDWAWNTDSQQVVSLDLVNHTNVFPLELNTMPGWAGSSWYFFRYMDPHNSQEFAGHQALNYWQQVDLYIGGSEHATGHLLYSRFWVKFLFDRGFVSVDEPFKKLINQGMILGESAFVHRDDSGRNFLSANQINTAQTQPIHVDVSFVTPSNDLDIEAFRRWRPEYQTATFTTEQDGSFKVTREVEKMSKSKFNVVNPDDICDQYGADTLRMYEMFLGPLEQAKPWSTAGITGVHGFLKKFWRLYHSGKDGAFKVEESKPSPEALKALHKTIKKVTEDIENFSFNTSVSTFMINANELTSMACSDRQILEPLLILIEPYAPHIAEELWQKMGHLRSISREPFPVFDPQFLVESSKAYPISFNGKTRFTLELSMDLTPQEIEDIVMAHEKTQEQLEGRVPKKVIVVPGKIVNIVG